MTGNAVVTTRLSREAMNRASPVMAMAQAALVFFMVASFLVSW